MSQDDLRKNIDALYQDLRQHMTQQWQRDLPFEELLFDRWQRAKQLNFAEGSSIYHNSYVYGEVQVGENTWIGPFTLLDGTGGLIIGDWCCISANVQIYTQDRRLPSMRRPSSKTIVILVPAALSLKALPSAIIR